MKYFIALLLVLSATSSQAQITTEHTYENFRREFSLVQVDSGTFKYIDYNGNDSIYIINLNHSLDRVIIVPLDTAIKDAHITHISKRLFDTDDAYEYLIASHSKLSLTVFKEDGTVVFGCKNCLLSTEQNYLQDATTYPTSIVNTPNGVKMLVEYYDLTHNIWRVTVFSLPGKLPSATTKSSVNSPSIINSNSLPVSAYPNPSNGQMRISYKLPLGVSTGELAIISTDGVEVKRYRVGYGFDDILIEKSDLPSGSYFYKLVTDKGESETQKLIILK